MQISTCAHCIHWSHVFDFLGGLGTTRVFGFLVYIPIFKCGIISIYDLPPHSPIKLPVIDQTFSVGPHGHVFCFL